MAEENEKKARIVVRKNGSYRVEGGVPLVRKTQVVSEHGEPLTWRKDGDIPTPEAYSLCRCGHSQNKPFCDGAHKTTGFDGTENASTQTMAQRQEILDGTGITVKKDFHLCMNSGFCGTRLTNVDQMTGESEDTQVRSLLMAMIERCPSGAYAYSIQPDGEDVEPDLPRQIAVTTEITSSGPIDGPLWVTGGIPVERSDGQPFETRNRVTLCNCGKSGIKPLCDGTHRGGR